MPLDCCRYSRHGGDKSFAILGQMPPPHVIQYQAIGPVNGQRVTMIGLAESWTRVLPFLWLEGMHLEHRMPLSTKFLSCSSIGLSRK